VSFGEGVSSIADNLVGNSTRSLIVFLRLQIYRTLNRATAQLHPMRCVLSWIIAESLVVSMSAVLCWKTPCGSEFSTFIFTDLATPKESRCVRSF